MDNSMDFYILSILTQVSCLTAIGSREPKQLFPQPVMEQLNRIQARGVHKTDSQLFEEANVHVVMWIIV